MEIPDGIKELGPEAQKRVEELVEEARRRQQQDLQDALDDTLRIVPNPLRGMVRRGIGL